MTSVSAMNFWTLLVKHKYTCQHREVKIRQCGKEWKEGNSFCSWKHAVGCVKKQLPAWAVLHYSMISFVIFFCSPARYWGLLTLLSVHLLVFRCTWWAALGTIEVDLDDKALHQCASWPYVSDLVLLYCTTCCLVFSECQSLILDCDHTVMT
jgi:hypothetical protein